MRFYHFALSVLFVIAAVVYYHFYWFEHVMEDVMNSMCPDSYHVYSFRGGESGVYTNSAYASEKSINTIAEEGIWKDKSREAIRKSLRWANGFVVNEEKGIIVYVAKTREELLEQFGKCKKWTDIEKDQMLMPSFTDSHVHVILGGLSLLGAPLRNVKSKIDFMTVVKGYEVTGYGKDSEWITGGEWNQNNWGGEDPDSSWVDHLEKPAFLLRMDGHSALANKKALQIAGVTKDTKNPQGGTIVRDKNGEPTGLLKDKAINLVYDHVPAMDEPKALQLAMEEGIRYGVTGVHHMGALGKVGGSLAELKTFYAAEQAKSLKYRIYASIELYNLEQLTEWISNYGQGSDWLKVGVLKEFFDGSIGSETALQYSKSENVTGASYYLNEENNGLQLHEDESLLNILRVAEERKFQVALHAIGEKAIDKLLDLFEIVFKEFPPRDRRWRIEHAQHTRPETRKRFADLGVIISANPTHMYEDTNHIQSLLGEVGCNNSYAFNSILSHLKNKNNLCFGSDWFVASLNPFLALDAAVNRVTPSYPNGFVNSERISLEEAIRAYTIGSSYAAFNENKIGALSPGYLADFVILDRNIFQIESTDLKNVRVLNTFVNGKMVYDYEGDIMFTNHHIEPPM